LVASVPLRRLWSETRASASRQGTKLPFSAGIGRARRGESRLARGIGLRVSRRLAEELGGRLWVTSAVGAGSAFYFALPLAPPTPDAPQHAAAALLLARYPASHGPTPDARTAPRDQWLPGEALASPRRRAVPLELGRVVSSPRRGRGARIGHPAHPIRNPFLVARRGTATVR
jgi:hypothetical protein